MTIRTTQLGTLDYGSLPPEINSARIYAGPGSGPILAAASAWSSLAAELSSAASSYSTVIAELTDGSWSGQAANSMAAAAAPYVEWMKTAAAQAEQTAGQAQAAAAAYESAFAMTIPPVAVAANRAQLAALVATNVVGQNTAAIATTEILYMEMWAQDAAAMYGYASSSAAAATVTPFGAPPQTTTPGRAASRAGAATGTGTQSSLSQVIAAVPNTLQGLSSPLSSASVAISPFASGSNTATTGIAGLLNLLDGQDHSAVGTFLASGFANGILSGNWFNPASLSPAVTNSFADIGFLAVAGQAGGGFNPALFSATATPAAVSTVGPGHIGAAIGSSGLGGSGVSAGVGRATLIGTMSVPQSWAGSAPVPATSAPATATQVPGWTIPPGAGSEEVSPAQGVPGMPGMSMGSGAPRGYGFAAPRYGFRPTVVARPPAAG